MSSELKIVSDFIYSGDPTPDDILELMKLVKETYCKKMNNKEFSKLLDINGVFPMPMHSVAHLRTLCEKVGLQCKIIIYKE